MIAFAGRRGLTRSALLLVGMVLPLFMLGCSAEARAKRGLRRIAYKEINQFNKYHQRDVKPKVYESRGRFYRIYHERVNPLTNMRRTNSIDTPYISTLTFTENIYLTHRRSTKEEAARDSHFILSNPRKREILFTFVNGSWKKKEEF